MIPTELRVAVLITGGIAAYKIADVTSQLVQLGADVRVAMTESATRFVGAVTLQGITGRAVLTDLWSHPGEPHVELGDWAQVILVAPATAHTLARLAHGMADDIVTATALAARCPIVVAPAMNDAMWRAPAVVRNVELLRAAGTRVVEPAVGRLASGHVGAGRLPDAATLLDALSDVVGRTRDLAGRRVVVSAGGTKEPIDPVRYIGNFSSGKMGFALARAAAARGAEVALVTTAEGPAHEHVRRHPVRTAADMLAALREEIRGADVLLMAAAVADFRPQSQADEKIRRDGVDELVLHLEKNVDILHELASEPGTERLYRVGFAAEGAELDRKAAEKIARKRLDAILANDIRRSDIAFGSDHNAGTLLFADGTRVELERMPKLEMAHRILDAIVGRLPPRE